MLQAGGDLFTSFNTISAHERVFPLHLPLFVHVLVNERLFAPTNRQKSKGSEKLRLTSGLNYPYLIRERGSFAFTAAAWGSNNAVEESSDVQGLGVTPQRNQKNRIQGFYS